MFMLHHDFKSTAGSETKGTVCDICKTVKRGHFCPGFLHFFSGDSELRLREGLRSKIATSNEYKKGTQAGDLLSNVR